MAETKTIDGVTYTRVPVEGRDDFFTNALASNTYFSISDEDVVTSLGKYSDTGRDNYFYKQYNQIGTDSKTNPRLYYISNNGATGGKRRRRSKKRRNSRKRRSYRRR